MNSSATPPPIKTARSTDLIADLIVDKFQADPATIRAETPMTDLLVDSLMIVEMAIALKDELGIAATEDELRTLTFGEFTARVDQGCAR
ncbi:acyl carrier protein [Streptomyces atriruber]|uniref:acyl carrier protein n=1 Tax=Streptomyces atriruber TaxID=545121 RepID=UPI0006E31E80|nr:acyl carrier protein [Streptomyces atriruber]